MKLLSLILISCLLIANSAIAGLVFSKTVTPTTTGVVVELKDRHESVDLMNHFISCADDDFIVTGWHYVSGAMTLVQNTAAYGDTTSATGLAGMIIPFRGKVHAFVVKPVAVSGAAINIQSFTLE